MTFSSESPQQQQPRLETRVVYETSSAVRDHRRFPREKKMPEPKKLKIETHFLVSRNRHKRKEKIANYFTESCADGCKNSFVHFAPQHMHQLESLATRSFNANCLTLIDKYFENISRKYLAEWKIFCKFLGILPRCHQKFH